jgi:hypothetical protein
MKSRSNTEVAILQGHRRKRDLFEGLAGNFLLILSLDMYSYFCWTCMWEYDLDMMVPLFGYDGM